MNNFTAWNITKQQSSNQETDEKFDPTFTTRSGAVQDADSAVDTESFAASVADVTARAVANAQLQRVEPRLDPVVSDSVAGQASRRLRRLSVVQGSHINGRLDSEIAHEQLLRHQIQQQDIHGLPIGPQQIQQLQIQLGQYDDIKPRSHRGLGQGSVHSEMPTSPGSGLPHMEGSPDLLNDESKPRSHNHRPVLTSKRAAQNRNAQRAFRQRKEKYIKELELRAAEAEELRKTLNDVRQENMQLRDYTLVLQSKVIELLGSADGNRNAGGNRVAADGSSVQKNPPLRNGPLAGTSASGV